jgi:hypothetical protein
MNVGSGPPEQPVRVDDALAAGATRGQLRSKSLITPVRGVRMRAAAADDLATRCQAISLRLPGDAAFSHATAAALWHLPLPRTIDPARPVHVIGPPGRPPMDARAIAAHEGLHPRDTVRHRGICLTTVPRTWADLGGVLDLTDLIILTDAILALTDPRTAASDLSEALARAAGRRGCRALRRAIGSARHHVDSPIPDPGPAAAHRVGLPAVGADLFDHRGCWIARPDLC